MIEDVLRQGRARTWTGFLVALVLVVATFLYGLAIWDQIPDEVPLHFGSRGEPTRWGEKSFGNVFLGLLLTGAGLFTVPVVAAVLPGFMMLPRDASDWARLRAEASVRGIRDGLGWMTAIIVAMVAWVSVGSWRAEPEVTAWPLVLLVALLPALWLAYTRWLRWGRRTAAVHGIHPTPEEEAEEALWLPLGLYNNPEDPRVFPPKREGYGVGTTINWATPGGKAVVAALVLVVVVPVALVLWFG